MLTYRRYMVIIRRFIFGSFLLIETFAAAQRLPQDVIPQNYNLTFTPDLAAATFNAAEIQFQKATITQGANSQEARVTLDGQREQANLNLGSQLAPGPASIH